MKQTFLFFLLLLVTSTANAQQVCNGGDVTAFGGAHTVYTCPGDGKPDVVIFARSGHSAGTNYQFVITNQDNVILAMPAGSRADLEGAGDGICYVWGFAYTGSLRARVGDNVFRTQFSTGCWAISRTRINLIRFRPDGGTVRTSDGRTSVALCTRDGYDDPLVFQRTTTSRAAYRYLVTDDNNNILAIREDAANIEGAPRGNCRVWGLSFTGNLMAQVGMNAATATLASNCWDLSDNFIQINRADVDGGEVRLPNGQTRIATTPGDGVPDVVTVSRVTASSARYAYIVTDDKNNVLGLPPSNSVNVEGAGPGLCRIWGISYTGNLTIFVGDKLGTKSLSTGCFDLSRNFVETVRNPVDGGLVSMPNGLTTRYTCPGDGRPDVVRFINTSLTPRAQYRYLVTDANNVILALPPTAEANLEGAGVGLCRIWGVSFLGNFTARVGQNAATAPLASGMFDLSDNFITTHRDMPVGGRVTMPDGQTTRYTCPGDGRADIVRFITTSRSDTRYQYIVTDDANTILGLPPANEVNLEAAGVGACRIWGVAYTGNLTARVGDNAARATLSDDCFSLSSNFIETLRFPPNGGRVATTTGRTTVNVTVGDGRPDTLSFAVTGNSQSRFAWVVTDDRNTILGLPSGNRVDFDDAGVGVCRVWGLSYTGMLTALPGDNAAAVALSTECFDLSDNFVTVNRVGNSQPVIEEIKAFAAKVGSKKEALISPNPAREVLNIQLSDASIDYEQPVSIQIINSIGTVAMNQTLSGSQINLEVKDLPTGVYFVKINQKDYQSSHKFFKQ
jgi:Secretion system C-terminal sorting domain